MVWNCLLDKCGNLRNRYDTELHCCLCTPYQDDNKEFSQLYAEITGSDVQPATNPFVPDKAGIAKLFKAI